MTMASLPWYDFAETVPAVDAFWSVVAQHLRDRGVRNVPDLLDRATHHEVQWTSPDLLLSQACGYDVAGPMAGRLDVVASPRFRIPGLDGATYRSHVAVRDDSPASTIADLRGSRAAVNSPSSHSGANALRAMVAPLARGGRFFSEVMVSGAHVESLAMISRGDADVAAIDAVTWALVARHRPSAIEGLRILADTAPAPAPPYVTRTGDPALRSALRAALDAAMEDPAAADARDALLLDGLGDLPPTTYWEFLRLESAAMRLGYNEIPSPAHKPLAPGASER